MRPLDDILKDYHAEALPAAIKTLHDSNPALLVLPGLRANGSPRLLSGSDAILEQPEGSRVYTSKYVDGGTLPEDRWRLEGWRVFEEIHYWKGSELKSGRVEVFSDSEWTQVAWSTGERKMQQAAMQQTEMEI